MCSRHTLQATEQLTNGRIVPFICSVLEEREMVRLLPRDFLSPDGATTSCHENPRDLTRLDGPPSERYS